MKNSFVLVLCNHHSVYFSYKVSVEFWKQVLPWLRDSDIDVGELKETDLIFDNFDIEDDSTLINHILSFGK